jgi:hypothetical protein
VDVLRASVAEVEDYTRIKVTTNTRAAITGPAVADVIHMIAELAENAVVFSPPNTPVLISGDVVGRGFAVEIEDRGLGLSEERRAELNDLLENPPPFDLSGSDQLGLFVASQLARKHNIRIVLRGSPYGGTTAIVLIPNTLVVSEDSYQPDGTDPATGTSAGVQLTGRHAARDETGGLSAVARDTASPAGKPVLTEVTATAPDDLAERWPADSGTDPWTAFAGAAGEDTGNGWPAHDATTTAASTTGATNGGNGFSGFPGPGDEGNWPPPSAFGHRDAAQTGDQEDTDFAEADSLPRRVRQASLAPQLRENTLHGRPAANGDAAAAPGIVAERSPEEARSTITAIQQGWERGRSLFDPPDTTTDAMTGTQPPAEPSPPEPGEAGPQGDE